MKNFKSDKYSNKRKFFYEDRKNKNDNYLRSIIFLHIFNNFDNFLILMENIRKKRKTSALDAFIFKFAMIEIKDIPKFDFDIDKGIRDFFSSLENFNFTTYNNDLIYNLISPLYDKYFEEIEEFFVDMLIKELKFNKIFFNNFSKNLDIDILLDLCLKYPKLRKYCPKSSLSDLYLILDILE